MLARAAIAAAVLALPTLMAGAMTPLEGAVDPTALENDHGNQSAIDILPHCSHWTKECSAIDELPGRQVPAWHILGPEATGSGLSASLNASANATLVTPWASAHLALRASIGTDEGSRDAPDGSWSPTVPCADPAGCPDLTLDPTKTVTGMRLTTESFTDSDCNVEEGTTQAGTRRLLRFSTITPNVGEGDLILGVPQDNPDWFTWATCHEHWHLDEFADYRLWTVETYLEWRQERNDHPDSTASQVLAANPALHAGLVSGHKQGFCVIDVTAYVPAGFPGAFHSCLYQGISVGWADEYSFSLDGQWIDVTDVEPGLYVLELEVNADRFFEESDYQNNAIGILAAVHGGV